MITLYTFGRAFGLPDPSTFVTKAETLLKMSGLEYVRDTKGFTKAPKGKLPYINDDGAIVADSTFIRLHLENKYNIEFDAGLTEQQRAYAWALEKLCEDQIYWLIVYDRWMIEKNFDRGPRTFFDIVPAPIRPLIVWKIRRGIKQDLHSQGIGRHTDAERRILSEKALASVAHALGDKDFLMRSEPCGADASVWSFIAGALCPHFETALAEIGSKHANLVAYRDRGMARWYPDLKVD